MNFKNIVLASAVIASSFVLSACFGKTTTTNMTTQTENSTTGQAQTGTSQDAQTVTITDSGMSPSTVTVKSGGKITWTNNTSKNVKVASDQHPTHTQNQEVSNGQFVLELAPGESATVTLTKTGTWGVHDHLNPSAKMKVIVE
ncbi:MAG: cupredoxin domain-containing protein [Candidatus Curtissbacteria bacterium]|nr:cupredoxin domain-containing protein [Candidatus Curtissbacteria bacterium]